MHIGLLRKYALGAGLLGLAVASCKKEAPPPPPVAVEPAPAPAASPLSVQSVDLGKAVGADKHISTPATTFGTRDTIYASVSTTGAAASATLGARWTFEKTGQLVDSTSVPIAPTGPAVTEFHVMRTSPWPTGKYKLAILLNGQPASEKEFEVKK
jgi:hypothetical protein